MAAQRKTTDEAPEVNAKSGNARVSRQWVCQPSLVRAALKSCKEFAARERPLAGYPFHPYLIAIFPCLAVYSNNVTEVSFGAVLGAGLIGLALAFTVAAVAHRLYGSRDRSALAASCTVAIVLLYGHAHVAVNWCGSQIAGCPIRRRYTLLLCVVILGGVLVTLVKTRGRLVKATRALNLLSVMAVGVSVSCILLRLASSGAQKPDSHVEDGPANEATVVFSGDLPSRDIYYLVFDRYGSYRTLAQCYDFDNRPFLEALEQRGFYVVKESCANYPETIISMSSALNMSYHDEWVGAKRQYIRQIQRARVPELLKQSGYTFYFFGNWYEPFRFNRSADVSYVFESLPSEYANVLYQASVFDALLPLGKSPARTIRALETIEEVASDSQLKFVYAHLLLPHPPYMFDADGSFLSQDVVAGRSEKENYVGQLAFTNRRILRLVDGILAKSSRAPVIVVQSDEGPYLAPGDEAMELGGKLRKRAGILMALYLPGVNRESRVPITTSPVNVFRIILREYCGANMELLADRTFYWEHASKNGTPDMSKPNRFIDVTGLVRQGGNVGSDGGNTGRMGWSEVRRTRQVDGRGAGACSCFPGTANRWK